MDKKTFRAPLGAIAVALAVAACGPQGTSSAPAGVRRPSAASRALSSNSSDLVVTLTDGVTSVRPGDTLTYMLDVVNNGPDPSDWAQIDVNPPPELTGMSWSCTGLGGATCPSPSGIGAISVFVGSSVPVGTGFELTITAQVDPTASGTVALTATASNGLDPNPANNSATDTDDVIAPSTT